MRTSDGTPGPRAPADGDLLVKTSSYLQRACREGLPGAQVAVSSEQGGQQLLTVGSALPDEPMAETTVLPAFCATMPLLGLGAALCAHRAGVALDDPLEGSVDLSEVVPAAAGSTLRQVLEHRAGFNAPVKLHALLLTPEARATMLRDAVPHGEADGHVSIYGNYTHPVILGFFIQQVSGSDAASWLHAELVAPLGMQDTYFSMSEATFLELRDRLGVHHWVAEGRSLPLTVLATELTSRDFDPAAGGWTTAADLVTFYDHVAAEIGHGVSQRIPALAETLDDLGLVGAQVREPTISPGDSAPLSYVGPFRRNLGKELAPCVSSRAYGHPGWRGTSFAFCDVERKVTVAVLCNWLSGDQSMIDSVRRELVQVIYDDLFPSRRERTRGDPSGDRTRATDGLGLDTFLRTVTVPPCRGLDVTLGFIVSDAPPAGSSLIIKLADGQVDGVHWRTDEPHRHEAQPDVWVTCTYQDVADYFLGRSTYRELLTKASFEGDVMAFIAAFGVVASEAWQAQGASWVEGRGGRAVAEVISCRS